MLKIKTVTKTVSTALLLILPGFPFGAQASITFSGSTWVRSGLHSNPDLVSPDLANTAAPDSNTGIKLNTEFIKKDLWRFSVLTTGEYQRYLSSGSAENLVLSFSPTLRAISFDQESFSTLSYRLSRSVSSPGTGASSDYTGQQLRYSFADYSSPNTQVTLNVKYKSNSYSYSSRIDGNLNLGLELRHPLSSSWSVGYEPSFENNSSEVEDFTFVSGALNGSVMWTPNDRLFMLLLVSSSVRFYAFAPATDTVYFALLTAEYSILKWLSLSLEFSITRSYSSVPSRENYYYNPLVGLEASF